MAGNFNNKEETGDMQFDASGNLKVNIQAGAGSGGTASVDDAAFTPASGSGTPAMGIVTADAVDSGDVGVVGMLANRQLKVTLFDSAGAELSVGGGTQYTEDAAATANPVGNAVNLIRQDTPASEVSANGDNIAQRGTAYGAGYVQVVNSSGAFVDTFGGGTQYTEGDTDATITGTAMMMEGAANALVPAQGTTADGLLVNLGTNNDVTITSGDVSVTQGGTFSTNNAGVILDDANWNIAAVEPLGLGAYASTATKAAVSADGDMVALWADRNGRLRVTGDSSMTALKVDGSAVTQPVSLTSTTVTGTVAVTQSGTWDEVGINDSGNSITVDNPQLSVVGGGTEATALRVTVASDSTGVLSVDDNGGSITVDGTVAVTATNLDVRDLVAATDAVTVHGDVGVVDQLDLTNTNPLAVAIVDGDGTQITSFGGGTQYTEDAAAAANPVGTVPILVRKDTPASEVTTDGDNVAQRGTTYGAAYVTLLDTGGSPVAVGGGTQYTEDAAAAADPIGTMGMAVRADTLGAVTSTDGDNIALRATNKGELYVKQTDVVPVSDNAGSLTIDNSTLSVVGGGTEATALRVTLANDSTGLVSIDDNGGSITVDGTVSVTGVATETTLSSLLTSSQLIDDTIVTLGTDTYTEASSKGQTIGAVRRDADTTLVNTTNEWGPLQMDANGRLKVEAFSGETLPVSLTSTTVTGTVAVTQSGTWDEVGINDSGNSITVDNPQLSVVGSGTEAAAMRVTIATDSTGVLSVDDNGSTLSIDDGAGSITVDGTVTANLAAGTNNIGDVDVLTINGQAPAFGTGVRSAATQRVTIATDDIVPASQSGTWTVQPGNTANTTAWLVTNPPVTSGGLSKFHLVSAATTNQTNVKASAGQVYSITAFNLNASPRYLKFHNTSGSPTAGSGVTDTFMIPGNTAGAGFVINFDKGIVFSTGIAITLVTGIADSNTTAVAADEIVLQVYYK